MEKQYYSTGEAAKLLGVSTDTLRRWGRQGHIVPHITFGGHRRYSLEEITRLSTGDLKSAKKQELIYISLSFGKIRDFIPMTLKFMDEENSAKTIGDAIMEKARNMIKQKENNHE